MNILEKLHRELKLRKVYIVFITVLTVGIFIHGSRIFGFIYYHDDLFFFTGGNNEAIMLGRWFLVLLRKIFAIFLGTHINTKSFMGIVSFLLLGVICCIIVEALKMKSNLYVVLISAVVVSFPYVASLLAYSYTAPYYLISQIMSMLAAMIVQRHFEIKRMVWILPISIILLGLAMAIYQVALCTFIAFWLIIETKNVLDKENEKWKEFVIRNTKSAGCCIGGAVFYFISNKLALLYSGQTLSSYKGLDKIDDFSNINIFERIKVAYCQFFNPSSQYLQSFYITSSIRYAYFFLLLMVFMGMIMLIKNAAFQKNYRKVMQLILLTVVNPLGIKAVFWMIDLNVNGVHSLMLFTDIMIYVYLLLIVEHIQWSEVLEKNKWKKIKESFYILCVAEMIFSFVYFGYICNVCYTKYAFMQEQATGYFNRMITRIQQTENYSKELKVLYINPRKKYIEGESINMFESACAVLPYHVNDFINDSDWKIFMEYWCGYSPNEVSEEEVDKYLMLSEVQQMPCYPNDNSIQVVEDVLVVKFAD